MPSAAVSQAALAVDERDVRAGVCRQHRAARRRASRDHQRLADLGPDAARGRRRPRPGASGRSRPRSIAGLDLVAPRSDQDLVVAEDAGDVGEEQDALGAEPDASAAAASSALTFSGPSASGATTGISPSASASRTACGRLGTGVPTWPSSGHEASPAGRSRRRRGRRRAEPIAAQSSRSPRAAPRARPRSRRRRSPAARGRTSTSRPARLHRRRDLRPAAVDDDGVLRRTRTAETLGASDSPTKRRSAATFTHASRRVLRVDLHVVVREVGGEVGGAGRAEPEVELDLADRPSSGTSAAGRLARRRRGRRRSSAASAGRRRPARSRPRRTPSPAAARMRPQFGSRPNAAVLTSGEVAIRFAIAFASPALAAPLTSTSSRTVAPSPSMTICRDRSAQTSPSAAANSRSDSRPCARLRSRRWRAG